MALPKRDNLHRYWKYREDNIVRKDGRFFIVKKIESKPKLAGLYLVDVINYVSNEKYGATKDHRAFFVLHHLRMLQASYSRNKEGRNLNLVTRYINKINQIKNENIPPPPEPAAPKRERRILIQDRKIK
jgi:hypothetical protein